MKHKQNEGSSCKEHYGIMISLDLISVVNIDLHAINSFMTEVLIIWKPIHSFALQINGLVSI